MEQVIYLDIAQETTPQVVFMKQQDSGRILKAFIQKDGIAIEQNAYTLAAMRFCKPNKASGMSIGGTLGAESGKLFVEFNIPSIALNTVGIGVADIVLTDSNSKQVSTQNFYINIRATGGEGVA